MKIYFFLSIAFLTGISFSQSKKEQIEQLNNRVDSLNKVLSSERVDNSKKISTLESSKKYLEERYNELENNYNLLVNKVSTLSFDLQTSQADIVIKQQEISDLQTKLRFTNDSIFILQDKIEHLKLSLVDNNKTHTISSQVTDINGKNYRTVIIGTQTWMAENLNVSTFRNGDPIPEAKTNEEWEKASKEGKPAWCYYENDPKNGAKYGKLYNWYAVNDPRGLAPAGWHIPSDAEWTTLGDHLGNDVAQKMKSTIGWPDYGCKRCAGESLEIKASCTSCKGIQNNSTEPFSGGSNSSGFSGLPGGSCSGDGTFYGIGNQGLWWSSTEDATLNSAWYHYLDYESGGVTLYGFSKTDGFSVRCLRN
jgi:uncharacterized protein (TIGR02145 family)